MISQEFEISEELSNKFKDFVFMTKAIEMAEDGLLRQRADFIKAKSDLWELTYKELKLDKQLNLSYRDGKILAQDDADEPPKG